MSYTPLASSYAYSGSYATPHSSRPAAAAISSASSSWGDAVASTAGTTTAAARLEAPTLPAMRRRITARRAANFERTACVAA